MSTQNPFSARPVLFRVVARRLATAMWSVTLLFAVQAHAAILTWSGGGANANWNNISNWSLAGIPTNGDTLVFPSGQPRLVNTNNIVSLTLNQIRFTGAAGGYAIFGNAITITNGIEATNTAGMNVISNNITLGSPGDFVVNVATGAKLFLGGTLNGSVGLIKTGGGTNTLGGGFSNSYGGSTTVSNGVVELSKFGAMAAAVPHDLIIGNGITGSTVRNLAGAEIADSGNVTVNRFSTWDLDDLTETISALTLSGGSVTTGTGTLTLGSNITSIASPTTSSISGVLSLGGVTRTILVGSGSASPDLLISANIIDGSASAGITKTGVGQLTLSGSNSFTGVLTVDGFVILANDFAAGAAGSSTNRMELHANAFLLVQGVNIGNEFLTLTNNDDFRSSGAASWAGPITLNGDVFINVFGGTFSNSGAITGAGGVTKGQSGTLIYAGNGPNTYMGDTIVNTGELQLAKSIATGGIVNGTLTIGDDIGGNDADVVREMGANQINSAVPITINSSGLLDLNNFSDAIGALTFSGGHLTTGTGMATLTGNITANTNTNNLARIDGKVFMTSTRTFDVAEGNISPDLRVAAAVSGTGGITKIGAGEMSLTASNSYTGLTTVSNGFLRLEDSFALGATNGGTVVNSGAVLGLLFGIHVGLEPLTVSGAYGPGIFGALSSSFGSNSWDGAITLASNATFSVTYTNDFLNLTGPISGTGDFTKIGLGTLIFSGSNANTYTGSTFFNEGTNLLSKSVTDGAIPHDLFVGDGTGGTNADVVRITGRAQIATVSDVTIASSGLLDLNEIGEGISTLSGFGQVDTGGTGTGALFINGSGSTTYSGAIIGAGGLTKQGGAGTFTLAGNNTYTGGTTINAGTLLVNGLQPQSPVTVGASGTLGGSGTVGIISASGNVSPGASPGILTSSNLIFSASGDFFVDLTGPTVGTDYDQLNVHGTNALANATLHVTPAFTGPVTIGQQFTILNNDGGEAIGGTFSGLANGAQFNAGGYFFRINYDGGTGNDVVLTLLGVPDNTLTLNALDRGWYDSTGHHDPANGNYFTGQDTPVSDTNIYRNWFVFNAPVFSNSIISAELIINDHQIGSPNAQETYVLRQVTTAIPTLELGGSGLTNIYKDLADGPVYGVRNISTNEAGEKAIITLNLAFINDLTAASGGQMALGGSISSLNPTNTHNQFLFANSLANPSDVQLRLTFGTSMLLNATNRGWYNSIGFHDASISNYFAGIDPPTAPATMRNFFVFNLPALSSLLASAQLSVNSYTNISPSGFNSYRLQDVTTPITTLTNSASGATNTFDDLGTGAIYGGRDVFVSESGLKVTLPLNGTFLDAAQANSGGRIALGGVVTSLKPASTNESLFAFSGGVASDVQLWLGFLPSPANTVTFAGPTFLGTNRFQFVLTGTTGTSNEIQASFDFQNWDFIRDLTMTNTNTTFLYTNTFTVPYRYFRARMLQ